MRIPKVSVHPRSIQVQPGSLASFSCNVGSTEATYKWQKKHGILSAQAVVDEEKRELTFKAVTVEDSGVYVCSAENTYGSDKEEAILQVLSGKVVLSYLYVILMTKVDFPIFRRYII